VRLLITGSGHALGQPDDGDVVVDGEAVVVLVEGGVRAGDDDAAGLLLVGEVERASVDLPRASAARDQNRSEKFKFCFVFFAYPSTQWPAVRTTSSAIKEPPQKPEPSISTATWYLNWPVVANSPPMMRAAGSECFSTGMVRVIGLSLAQSAA
jgi:hypothetical protein